MKRILPLLVFLFMSGVGYGQASAIGPAQGPPQKEGTEENFLAIDQNRLKDHIAEAKAFCEEMGLNTQFAILVDMKVHSGKNRLFVVDLKKDIVVSSGLCSHGCCDSEWSEDWTAEDPTFSNVPESHCSSLGKYKIGKRGYSNWGIHVNYKLHGLEASNSNAYKRLIVLHSWDQVPNVEIYPSGTPEGWGCPAVSNEQMRYLDRLIKSQEQSLLLWIYQ